MSVSACRASASAATSRILRTLLPPNANAIASSRFTSSRGPPPSAVRRRGISSTGVAPARAGPRAARQARRIHRVSILGYGDDDPSRQPALRPRGDQPAELRPPRAELEAAASMDAWIDTYHAVRSLTRHGTYVFLTDSAVGLEGGRQPAPPRDQPRHRRAAVERRAVPDVASIRWTTAWRMPTARTSTGSTRSSSSAATRASARHDASSTPGSCASRSAVAGPDLALGGWANPHADPQTQVGHLLDEHVTAEFYLTQIVSHHSRPEVERFLEEAGRRGLTHAGAVRRVLLPLGESEDADHPERVPARAGRRADEGVRRRRDARRRSARDRFASCARRAFGTSTSATCRSGRPRRRCSASWRWSDAGVRSDPGLTPPRRP